MMKISRLCSVVVVALAMTVSPGCGGPDVMDHAGAVGQVEQDLTGCELDCPTGEVFTCTTVPCSVTATTLTCNGTTTSCPTGCDTCDDRGATCGTIHNNCGDTLSCGTCGAGERCVDNTCEISSSCPIGTFHCCDEQTCNTLATCHKRGC